MVIHAYSDDYLTSAQRILGDMLDFAVNTYDMDIDKLFLKCFWFQMCHGNLKLEILLM